MLGNRYQWQLVVKQSDLNDIDWVHHWSKYHYFKENGFSLCDKYTQDWEWFETYPNKKQWSELTNDSYCSRCLKILKRNERSGDGQ